MRFLPARQTFLMSEKTDITEQKKPEAKRNGELGMTEKVIFDCHFLHRNKREDLTLGIQAICKVFFLVFGLLFQPSH